MILHIIHLPKIYFHSASKEYQESIRRKESFEKEMKEQGIAYVVHDAILNEPAPFTGCIQSHKAIVREATHKGFKEVAIAEDDIKFFAPGAWDYFLKCKPESFDLYLGMSYSLNNFKDGLIRGQFDSLTLYIISERFYDEFLALPEDNHADRELSRICDKKEFRICIPYVAEQLNGYSYLAKRERTYEHRIADKPKFGLVVNSQ